MLDLLVSKDLAGNQSAEDHAPERKPVWRAADRWNRPAAVGAITLFFAACGQSRSDKEPPAPGPPPGTRPSGSGATAPSPMASMETSASTATAPSTPKPSTDAPRAAGGVQLDVVLAGDAIPQVKVLANAAADIFAGVPSCWTRADARVMNLEAPVGERADLPGDRSLLYFASPPSWVGELVAAARPSAFVVANNHSCDLGAAGLARTFLTAKKLEVPPVGADPDDPFRAVRLVERDGRRVCLVAWTTFLNDKGKKAKDCLEGAGEAGGVRLARAELGARGTAELVQRLGAPGRFDGCDARIAYIHGGREYQGQIRPLLEQAAVAARWVDAVVISHPHVPDGVEVVAAASSPTTPDGVGASAKTGDRAPGRKVPVFRSLGNFVSNQGIAWTPGMSLDIVRAEGAADPIRTVWTRVSVLARLRFSWEAGLPSGAPPRTTYGYSLAFTDRSGKASAAIRLRAMPATPTDSVAEQLARGPKPFGPLLHDPCRVDADQPPHCSVEGTQSVTTDPR